MKQRDCGSGAKRDNNRPWDALGIFQTQSHDRDGSERDCRSLPGNCIGGPRERLHAMEEIAGDMVHAQAEEISNLRAGDEDGDAVGETDNYWAREILYGSTHAGDAEKNE